MAPTFTPMMHVPDVKATALWYQDIGFTVLEWHEEDAEQMGNGPLTSSSPALDWARLRLGDGLLMFGAGGQRSDAPRREVDLYVDLRRGAADPGVDALHVELRDRVQVVEEPYDAFHGNRELIIRDLNGFWITFAQPIAENGR